MHYKVIQQQSLPGLEQEVNTLLKQGYTLAGGMVTACGYYYQALQQLDQMKTNIDNVMQVSKEPKEQPQIRRKHG
jgi:hypothetical protein